MVCRITCSTGEANEFFRRGWAARCAHWALNILSLQLSHVALDRSDFSVLWHSFDWARSVARASLVSHALMNSLVALGDGLIAI